MFKSEVRERKLSRLQKNLKYLQTLSQISLDSYLQNFEKQYASRHALQENIQICIDIAFHLCIVNKLGEPNNYKDAFKILHQNQIISKKLSTKMQNWVGLRNIITYIYEEADDEIKSPMKEIYRY